MSKILLDMTHAPLTLIPLQKSYLVWLNTSAKETPKQIKTKRPFQYRNEDIRDKEVACSPLVTCDEVADRWALLGLWHSWDDGETYSTISQHFNWMGEVLRGVMAVMCQNAILHRSPKLYFECFFGIGFLSVG
uniref:Uncharacterized protein n=1 Tax=Romanomermis culicivorax TaxID=13658 RepID=A0A915IA67_ROMCU